MRYVPELGGCVPIRNEFGETTLKGIYVAGDASGIEEATSAMIAGMIAGIHASGGAETDAKKEAIIRCKELMKGLREGPFGEKTRSGIEKAVEKKADEA
jgi:sarcosine oxidase subunit alpha